MCLSQGSVESTCDMHSSVRDLFLCQAVMYKDPVNKHVGPVFSSAFLAACDQKDIFSQLVNKDSNGSIPLSVVGRPVMGSVVTVCQERGGASIGCMSPVGFALPDFCTWQLGQCLT